MTPAMTLQNALNRRILVTDGAMGTAIQSRDLSPADYGGPEYENCNEHLVFTRPDVIREIHQEYLEAGCDILETNTFGSTRLALQKYGLGDRAQEQNRVAAQIARKAADQYSSEDHPRFVAGALGPPLPASFTEHVEDFYIQAKGLWEGGVDFLLLETFQELPDIQAGLLAFEKLFQETQKPLPIAVSVTVEPNGKILSGQTIEELIHTLSSTPLLYLGVNCATGPEFMTASIRTLAKHSPFRVACVPNAGLPDENGCYLESPQMFSQVLSRFVANGWINVLGGCCGTHARHIKALCDLVLQYLPRVPVGEVFPLKDMRSLKVQIPLSPGPKVSAALPLLERLSQYIVMGTKDGLNNDLNTALNQHSHKALDLINGPLMQGMDEVSRRFQANEMMISEVLRSAEVMKTAVAYLEPLMEKSESTTAISRHARGKVLLATVKGDVHEIGKNLVEIILANNGFEVIDLGSRVPTEQLINAVREHQPDIVGLSGLLVKSAHQMVTTAEDFSKAGVQTPLLVGGAALSSNFVDKKIAKAYTTGTVVYANDAMSGLDLAKAMVDPVRFKQLKSDLETRRAHAEAQQAQAQAQSKVNPQLSAPHDQRSLLVPLLEEVPTPPDYDRHVLRNTPIEQIWNFINPLMLYGRHLGIRGATVRLLERSVYDSSARDEIWNEIDAKDPKARAVWETVQEVKSEYGGTEALHPAAIYQFFHASSQGNDLILKDRPELPFQFPRQRKRDGLCLTDYVAPSGPDSVAFFTVTVGKGVRALAEMLKNRGDYLKSHIIQALALESAEAYAELIHSQIRKAWGYPDPPDMKMLERFQAKYRGKRYSFGYPACPKLDDQALLWSLLSPQEIGIQLTDGFMMDPESSVSALVFHHPAATYFSVGHQSGEGSYEDNR